MASLDTNCLLRWFLDDVPAQRLRVERLIASGESLAVDDAAIIETIFALEKVAKLSRATVQALWRTAMAHPLTLNRTLWTQVLDTWASHPKLSVVDVYLAAKAQASGQTPLYTFDTKMVNQLKDVALVPQSPTAGLTSSATSDS